MVDASTRRHGVHPLNIVQVRDGITTSDGQNELAELNLASDELVPFKGDDVYPVHGVYDDGVLVGLVVDLSRWPAGYGLKHIVSLAGQGSVYLVHLR